MNALLGLLALATAVAHPAPIEPVDAETADSVLRGYTARYQIARGVLKGELVQTLSVLEDGYRAESRMQTRGLARLFARGEAVETSWFRDSERGPQPYRFESNDSLSHRPGEIHMTLDWTRGRIDGESPDGPFHWHSEAPTWDRVSIQYALMHDLRRGHEADTYFMADERHLRRLEISHLPASTREVPAGTFEVVGVGHQAEGSSRRIVLWCAPALDYLPVVIEQYKNGELRVRATLDQVVFESAPEAETPPSTGSD